MVIFKVFFFFITDRSGHYKKRMKNVESKCFPNKLNPPILIKHTEYTYINKEQVNNESTANCFPFTPAAELRVSFFT